MMFRIEYHRLVAQEDIPRLSQREKIRIKRAIEEKLVTQPEKFGKPLRRSLRGYRKLRVGDYRIVYRIQGNTVKILIIRHRSVVYEIASRRVF